MVMGVMLESNLEEGRQDIPASGPGGLKYGVSVTGKYILWSSLLWLLTAAEFCIYSIPFITAAKFSIRNGHMPRY